MNTLLRGAVLVCAVLAALPQRAFPEAAKEKAADTAGTSSYQTLRYQANSFEGGALKPGSDRKPMVLKGAVVLTLIPEDASRKALVMHANEAIMKPAADGGTAPESVELNGKVSVDSDMGVITSDKAVMNMKDRKARFTGNVTFKLDQNQGTGKAESLTIDMDTQAFEMVGHAGGEMQIGQGDSGDGKGDGAKKERVNDPSLLKAEDILDWPGLIGKIQEQGAGTAASPGKQILSLLSGKARDQFTKIPAAQIPDGMKPAIVGQLNGVIRNPKLFDTRAWQDMTLDDETNALLRRRATLEPAEVTRLNRLVLEAAYPNMIAPAKKAG